MTLEPLVRATDISKSYGRHHVLDHIALDLYPGTLVGIVGENGAGKSTLLRILAGDLRPDSGNLTLNGKLGYCPQTVTLNDSLTVAQHLDYFRAAYQLSDLQVAARLVDRLGFAQYQHTTAGALSGGTRQKLNLTLALMNDPATLLLDEPYQGFDWETYLHFWELASDLRAQGRGVLVISHLLFDQERFDAIYQLKDGRLVVVKSMNEQQAQPLTPSGVAQTR